jgi:hypothetical protein
LVNCISCFGAVLMTLNIHRYSPGSITDLDNCLYLMLQMFVWDVADACVDAETMLLNMSTPLRGP